MGPKTTVNVLPTPAAEEAALPGVLQRPLVALLLILVAALGLRLWRIGEPLQRDEFGVLYALAERQPPSPGAPPTAADPLVPVGSLAEVRERSVLPFGIVNPVPVYHYLVYGAVKILPITEWSLRLLSLLAGLCCVAAVYFLCRRLLGPEVALVGALLAAVEPMQVATSVMARPYALGNLACVLSFAALLGLLRARTLAHGILAALGYGVAVALTGYLNPVLLLTVVAHLGVAVYWLLKHRERAARVVGWLVGCGVAAALLGPELGYIVRLQEFAGQHRDYLLRFNPQDKILAAFLAHNSTFLVGLLVVTVAGYIVRQPFISGDEKAGAGGAKPEVEARPAPEAPLPENPDVVWVGNLWVFLPQLAALVLAYVGGEAIFQSRFLSFTTLGAVLPLAYLATRERTPDLRLGVSGAVVAAVVLWSFVSYSRGYNLSTPSLGPQLVKDLDGLESFREGDVVLLRASLPEGDFLADDIPAESRRQVAGALAAPLTTLYVPARPTPVIVLTRSMHCERADDQGANGTRTLAGELCRPDHFYTNELGSRLRACPGQLWIANDSGADFGPYVTCLLPWLADQLDSDLTVARNRRKDSGERYFVVPAHSAPDKLIDGLSNKRPTDFDTRLIRVQRGRVAAN